MWWIKFYFILDPIEHFEFYPIILAKIRFNPFILKNRPYPKTNIWELHTFCNILPKLYKYSIAVCHVLTSDTCIMLWIPKHCSENACHQKKRYGFPWSMSCQYAMHWFHWFWQILQVFSLMMSSHLLFNCRI